MKCKAYVHKLTIDREGEAKLVLIVSKTEAKSILDIPTETLLDIEIIAEE